MNLKELAEKKIARIIRSNIRKVAYKDGGKIFYKIRGYEQASKAVCDYFKKEILGG